MQKNELEVSGNVWSTFSFFLIGVATGAALTVLLAPRSGAETRRLIGRTFQKGEDWVKTKAGAAQGYVRSQGADLRERANEVAAVIGRSSAQAGG